MIDLKITDFTENGKCSNCGECCSDLLRLSKYEISIIKRYIKKHNIKEQRHNAMVGYDMTCPFRDEANKRCLIYNVRPQICKSFMCNHRDEDIAKSKIDFHKVNKVVCMRNEFFGNTEDVDFFKELFSKPLLSKRIGD